jgi:hypothetical protein
MSKAESQIDQVDHEPDHARAPLAPNRLPTLSAETVDRLNITQALRDFELANARVIDLTGRLTALHEQHLDVQHQRSLAMLNSARADDLQRMCDSLVHERDAARQLAEELRASRSYRIGNVLVRAVRKLLP